MRITGGSARGRRLLTPGRSERTIRPTTDRAREAAFNILSPKIAGATVLDLFAGTGAFGLEALSRGADTVYFAERDPAALQLIARNLQTCFARPPARVFQLDLSRFSSFLYLRDQLPAGRMFDLVFLDPPYEKNLAQHALEMVEKVQFLTRDAIVLAEERSRGNLPETVGSLHLSDRRRYGETGFWLYNIQETP